MYKLLMNVKNLLMNIKFHYSQFPLIQAVIRSYYFFTDFINNAECPLNTGCFSLVFE